MKVQSARPYFTEDDINGILKDLEENLKNGELLLGQRLTKFEEMFAQYVGVKHAVGVASGTAALEIVLRYLNLQGGEVIIPTNSFVSCANSVYYAGGKAVLADINEDTLCLDPKSLKEKITPNTKAVMLVHLSGLITPHYNEIKEICKNNNLILIEDCAQSAGASIDGKKAGSLSMAGCFSFFATKPMTTGQGGMIATNDTELDKFARSARHHGIEGRDNFTRFGHEWIMPETNAILGIYQLKRLEENVKRRNQIAETYHKTLSKFKSIKFIMYPSNTVHAYYKYPIILPFETFGLQKILKEKYEIDTGFMYYPPIHLQPLYQNFFGFKPGMYPVAEDVLKRVICLPMFVSISEDQINHVIQSLSAELESAGVA